MNEVLDFLGRAVSVGAVLAVALAAAVCFGANEMELWRYRQDHKRAQAQHPIADRWRQPPGGWRRR